jgi:hypothetical protein
MDIRKAMKIRDNANSEVKLTKAGEKYSTATEQELETFFDKTSVLDINLNELLGIAVNPMLSSTQIRAVFKLVKEHTSIEKDDKSVKPATVTRNHGIRGKIRKQLSLHQNLDKAAIKTLLQGRTFGTPAVLNNPNVDTEDLDDFFERKIMTTAQGTGYNFVTFKELMTSTTVTEQIALKWYNKLKKYADWDYKDNQWYAIIDAYLEFDDCPFEILKDIMDLSITDNQTEYFNKPLRYRKAVVAHKNSTDELRATAYEKTGLEEFLPQSAKDLFLF